MTLLSSMLAFERTLKSSTAVSLFEIRIGSHFIQQFLRKRGRFFFMYFLQLIPLQDIFYTNFIVRATSPCRICNQHNYQDHRKFCSKAVFLIAMYTIGKNQLLQHTHALYIQHSPQKNIYLNSSHSFLGYTGGFYSAEQTQKSENVSLNMLNWMRKSTALHLQQY